MPREAGSLEGLLAPFGCRVSPRLIGEGEWRRAWERVRRLPVTLAAFPYGFELPLLEPRPVADLGLSLLGDSLSEKFNTSEAGRADADPSTRAIVRLLDSTRPKDSTLRRIVGRKMMFEYDVPQTPEEPAPAPGVFLYPGEGVLTGGSEGPRRDLRIVVDALVAALGRESDPAERREAERMCAAIAPGAAIRGAGAFLSRKRAIRFAVTGFRTTSELRAFLKRTGWGAIGTWSSPSRAACSGARHSALWEYIWTSPPTVRDAPSG